MFVSQDTSETSAASPKRADSDKVASTPVRKNPPRAARLTKKEE